MFGGTLKIKPILSIYEAILSPHFIFLSLPLMRANPKFGKNKFYIIIIINFSFYLCIIYKKNKKYSWNAMNNRVNIYELDLNSHNIQIKLN